MPVVDLAAVPFTSSTAVLNNVAAYLRERLVERVPILDREELGGDTLVRGPAVLSSFVRYDGPVEQAITRGAQQRRPEDMGKPFGMVGWATAKGGRAAANGQAVIQSIPLSVVVVLPSANAADFPSPADAWASDGLVLDTAMDWVTFWLSARFVNPAALGVFGLFANGDADSGDVENMPVLYRRVFATVTRPVL